MDAVVDEISKPRGREGGREENTIINQPQGVVWDTQGEKSNLLCSVAPPGGKVTNGVMDWVMGSLKAKLFEREVL